MGALVLLNQRKTECYTPQKNTLRKHQKVVRPGLSYFASVFSFHTVCIDQCATDLVAVATEVRATSRLIQSKLGTELLNLSTSLQVLSTHTAFRHFRRTHTLFGFKG